ncbi:glycosyltransferase family 4 protein [Brevibacillus migulae]|uniref:glycosyltransferase family 4 protein n=1 Tax=Brevibacillus migulae TaxID=1644114 RepID=UPI00142F8A3C|nr:glycosyltransferase family 4 protein [Brevibacillus migulae]
MKILYIHQYFTTREGTLGTRSYEFAKYFVKKGHQVTVLTGDSYLPPMEGEEAGWFTRTCTVDGIRIIAVKNAYSNYMGFLRRALAFFAFVFFSTWIALFLKRHDLVFATSTPLTVAITALLLKKLRRIPFVFEVRDLWPEAPIQMGAVRSRLAIRLLRWLERTTYREAVQVVGLSPGMVAGILDTGIPQEKVSMIPNCSDLELFDPSNATVQGSAAVIRRKLSLEGKLVVLHGGAMGVANGLDSLIRTAILLQQLGESEIFFIFAGEGKTRPEMEKTAREQGLTNILFTGAVPRKEMPLYLSMADVTVTSFRPLPILATNSPNKFFDSLAAGKPVIVNAAGWTKEIVESYGVGFYVDPHEPENLARLLRAVKNDKERLWDMGIRARRLAEEKYDRIKLAGQMEELLAKALNQAQTVSARGRVWAK